MRVQKMKISIFRLVMAVFLTGYASFYWWHAFKKGIRWGEFNFRKFFFGVPDSEKSCGVDLILFGLIMLGASIGFLFLPR
jgi:hypothetical protein